MCSAGMEGIGGREVARSRRAVAIPERAKVVAMMAVVMLLCNADRVVMSVAVVPLAAKYGWSSSFLGIVQVRRLLICHLHSLLFFFLLINFFVYSAYSALTTYVCSKP